MRLRKDAIDITGNRYGKLIVIEIAEKGIHSGVRWICQCDCGTKCVAYGGHLRAGQRVSCGCMAEEKIHETGVNKIFSLYKRKSRLRNKEFNLSYHEFEILINGNCDYCGVSPKQLLRRQKSKKPQIYYNGIDRIDSSKGYVLSNCVSACRYCNQAKSDMSIDEFKNQIERIYKWLLIGS